MKRLFLLALFSSLLFSAEYDVISATTEKIKKELGKKFNHENSLFKKSRSYKKFIAISQERNTKEVGDKTTLVMLPYTKLFDVLIDMDKESPSLLPSLYAYNLMLFSYGTSNDKINEKYGQYFVDSLARKNLCEGYVWGGDIASKKPESWKHSRDYYQKAKEVCKVESLKKKSAIGYARIDYLIKQNESPKKKK